VRKNDRLRFVRTSISVVVGFLSTLLGQIINAGLLMPCYKMAGAS